MIFGINTTSDISKLSYVISRAVRRVKFETILKYPEWYLCQISRTNHTIICLYYYQQKVCNFHIYVFQIKLKYHCQSNCRNSSCSSITWRNFSRSFLIFTYEMGHELVYVPVFFSFFPFFCTEPFFFVQSSSSS